MGNSTSSALSQCLTSAVEGNTALLAFPDTPLYQEIDVKPYNLDIPITPAAVTYPQVVSHVSGIVKCAAESNLKVQARCGGHSYANYGIGGVDGAVVIDLKNMQHFSMDESTWVATIGGGTLLADVTTRLHDAGGRAMAHGTCPQVGIGGHATIGGLGPTSRMWGSALDHIIEAEVVLANGSIVRASETKNPDVFFAVKGAGASFGVVTEFIVRTEVEPGQAVIYAYSFTEGSYASKAQKFKDWQTLISAPDLTRKFASEVVISDLGLIITGTFFGTQSEFDALGLDTLFPDNSKKNSTIFTEWLDMVDRWAEDEALKLGGAISSAFYSKSLVFTPSTLIPDAAIDNLFQYFDTSDKGTVAWFAIFDLGGGATSDVPMDATAFGHRDALFYMQTYAIDLEKVSDTTRAFITGINDVITTAMPGVVFGAYAGYVDPALPNGQEAYWATNLPKLEQIKRVIDPNDVFHNPQSVQPATS